MKKLALLTGLSVFWLSTASVRADEEADADAAGEAGEAAADDSDKADSDAAKDEKSAEPKAEDAANVDAEPTNPGEEDFGHGGQFGLRLDATWGYRMVFRYPESPFCAEFDPEKTVDDQQQFCGHGGPWGLDAGLSFALLDSIEPYVWGRFGLEGEPQTNTEPVVIVGAGLRIYTMSDAAFKVFVEPAVGFEFEGAAKDETDFNGGNPADAGDYAPEYKKDLVFHIAAGPHWDFSEHFGAYLTGGLTVGVLRYISASMELQFGVQARL